MFHFLGHLVNDQRPPTVLNVIPPAQDEETQSRDEETVEQEAAAAVSGTDLDLLSAQLRDKTRDLLAANLSQTKYFFKKLKKYIDFLSAPSETVAECRYRYTGIPVVLNNRDLPTFSVSRGTLVYPDTGIRHAKNPAGQ